MKYHQIDEFFVVFFNTSLTSASESLKLGEKQIEVRAIKKYSKPQFNLYHSYD